MPHLRPKILYYRWLQTYNRTNIDEVLLLCRKLLDETIFIQVIPIKKLKTLFIVVNKSLTIGMKNDIKINGEQLTHFCRRIVVFANSIKEFQDMIFLQTTFFKIG